MILISMYRIQIICIHVQRTGIKPHFPIWLTALDVDIFHQYNDVVMSAVAFHQPHECLLNRLFGRRSKETSKLRVTGLCVGNSPGTGEFPAQRASNAENVSIWWRHHDVKRSWLAPHTLHLKGNIILMTFSSVASSNVIQMRIYGTAYDYSVSITLPLQCNDVALDHKIDIHCNK